MKISVASDHGGFPLKESVKTYLESLGHEVKDFGCYNTDSCDYPDFGAAAARAVASGQCERGVVVCSTGIGISICANKIHGVRCALCGETYSAEMTRRHNNANMLALGASIVGDTLAKKIVDVFLATEFEGGRHDRRVNKVMALENE